MKGNDFIVMVFCMAFAMGLFLINEKINQRDKAKAVEIQKLKDNLKVVLNYDSIQSVSEKKLLDTLAAVREELQTQIDRTRNENAKLRVKNAALERRFRDLDLGLRPVY